MTRILSVWASSASTPAKEYCRKSRNGRSRSVRARSLRNSLSVTTIFSPYSLRPTMQSDIVENDGDVLALHVVVDVLAALVPGECGVRRELDARPDLDDELGLGDILARRVALQHLACLVEIDRVRDLLGSAADELVRALQVVIAVQRLVDLVRERRLVVRIGTGRIEVFRGAL